MNPNMPFSGQQPGMVRTPSNSSAGAFPVQPPFHRLPLFEQSSGGLIRNPGFTHLPDFTITAGLRGSSGHTMGFGQPPGFTQSFSLGQATSFVTPSAPPSTSIAGKQRFSFKPPSNLGTFQSASNFEATSGGTSGSGFAGSGFSFKTAENTLFNPIFDTGSEQEKIPNRLISSCPTFSFPGDSGQLTSFGMSQETSSSSASTNFSVSNPVSGNALTSSISASSSSRTVEKDEKRAAGLFSSPSSSFISYSNTSVGSLPLGETFPMSRTSKPECEELPTLIEPLPLLGKGTKRKEEQDHSPRKHNYEAAEEPELLARSDHAGSKRPVKLTRPSVAGGVFGRTMQDILKSSKGSGHPMKESKVERVVLESGDVEQTSVAGGSQSGFAVARLAAQEGDPKAPLKDSAISSPLHRKRNSGNADSLEGSSSIEPKVFHCKAIPDHLNDRNIIGNYFKKFVRIKRIRSIRNKKLAIISCYDHESAVLAKKKAKGLHENIVTFWQKKRPSPNKRGYLSKEQKADESEGRQSNEELSCQPPPLCKSLIRSTASGNLSKKSSPVKKPGLKKSLQFESDIFDSGSEGHGSENLEASTSSLSSLIGVVAETSEDKYRLLDQRDKIMRQARVKRTDLGRAKTFVGTCPDMCPEKERYMRETRNQLSPFEVLPGTDKVDHAAAIKEYSRSSADQEEPLPHELRPSEVLSMTMDYLVTQIMDKGEGNYREWYDFVWNRTRGIRKDITQQHLCGPLTVALIEKCTRFHIHCSHHLCEEPMSSFDAKINNENMTKCLQSLKEMYQDLANKGIYCKNEAEFRGYNVLLNLNKGDILREVQQFLPAVRNSAEVRFAVQAFAALNSNNFVRFFKLVQTASYLNACLLHCYFSQIRRDALRSLNIAYTVNAQRSTIFPLENVVRMLLFKDSEDATDFISYYGLSVTDGFVELNRSAFLERESLPKPKKSLFVRQKLMVSVGEIVNGEPLQPVTRHVPVCSFNGQNKYRGENAAVDLTSSTQKASADVTEQRAEGSNMDSEMLQVQSSTLLSSLVSVSLPSVTASAFQPTVVRPLPSPPKPKPVYSEMDISEVVEDLVNDVLEGECREISHAATAYAYSSIRVSDTTTDELITEAMLEILRQIAHDVLHAERQRFEEEKRQAEEQRRKQEKEKLIKTLSQLLGVELTEEVVKESVKEISAMELRCAVEKDQRARIARCSEEVCTEITGMFLEDEIFQTAKETLQELQCFCKYLQRWREAVAARKKLKRQMRAFPAAPCCVDPNNKLKALSPSAECPIAREHLSRRIVNLGHAGNLGTSCLRLGWLQNKTIHQMKVQYFYQQLLWDAVWTPLDLPSLVAENIEAQQEKVFWKVFLVLPSYDDYPAEDPSRILADWLKAKFQIDKNLKETTPMASDGIQTLALHTSLHIQEDRSLCVSVCIKVTHGTLDTSELDNPAIQKELLGTSGLILLLPPRLRSEDVAEEDVYWLSALLQLKQLLQAKPFQPIVPLVVLVPSHGDEAAEKEVEEGLMLPDLISANLISGYIIVEIPDSVNDLQGTCKLSEAMQWLISHCPKNLELCCQTLIQYIEDGIDREFNHHFFQDKKERRLAGLPSQDPSAIIELYNSTVQFLADVASSEELCDLSWPVPEFAEPGGNKVLPHLHWNTPSHLAWVKKALLSFQIPHMDLPPLGAPWHPVCAMIFQYLSQVASSLQTQEILQSQIQNLLRSTYLKWKGRKCPCSRKDGPSVDEIPWDSFLALCINHKLRDWKPPRLPVIPEAVSNDGQMYVYYFKEHLRKFTPPFLWEEARLKTQKEIQQSQGRSKVKIQSFPKLSSYSLSPPKYGANQESVDDKELSISKRADFTVSVSPVDHLPECLSARLQLEKAESRRFDEQLQQLVENSKPFQDSSSLPLYLPEVLVSMPQIIHPLTKAPTSRSPEAGSWMELKDIDTSLSHRLAYLKQLIRSNEEEEMACKLHVSTLLDMMDS
ncbi:germinal-center associated nuclear protein isoform X2 [Tiliqua scincoides]|uniref:germinal-center associated nuclear protein isoform X2 n=1 Tax=Tiliqua scincoides TaxID=71010 RepID=UPI003462755E